MSSESGSRSGLFSEALEEFIIHRSDDFSGNLKNPNTRDYKLASKLTKEETEAYVMYMNWQSGIKPTEYHYFYDQGDTIMYQEHIEDIYTISKMFENRHKYREGQQKREAESKALQEKLKKGQKIATKNQGGASQFFGKNQYTYQK